MANHSGKGGAGWRSEKPLGAAEIPRAEGNAQSGARHLPQGARGTRAVEREAAPPRLLPTQRLSGFSQFRASPALRWLFRHFFFPEGTDSGPAVAPPALVSDRADGMSLEVSCLPRRPWGLGPRVGSRRSLPGGNGQVRKEAHARVPPRTARSKSQNVLARVQGPLGSVVSMNYMLQIIGQWEKDDLRNY